MSLTRFRHSWSVSSLGSLGRRGQPSPSLAVGAADARLDQIEAAVPERPQPRVVSRLADQGGSLGCRKDDVAPGRTCRPSRRARHGRRPGSRAGRRLGVSDQRPERLCHRVGFAGAREHMRRIAQALVLGPEAILADAVLDETQERPRLLQILARRVDGNGGVRESPPASWSSALSRRSVATRLISNASRSGRSNR